MANSKNIEIYEQAKTAEQRGLISFTGKVPVANWRTVYTRLYQMGWRAEVLNRADVAPRYYTFTAFRRK